MHHPSLSCRRGAPRPQEPQQLALGSAGVRVVPAAPTRGSPSLPLSSPASRSAHTGAPARGRAGGGGRCCPSLSPRRADRPPCCGSRGCLTLSLLPQPSTVSRRSSGGDPDGDASGSAGWREPGSQRRAPACGEQAAWLGRSPSDPDNAEGFGQCDVAVLLLGGGQGRLLQLLCRHRQPPVSFHPPSPRIAPGGRAWAHWEKRAPSPKSVPSTTNFPRSPSARCSLRQPRERCAPSRAARPLSTRHPWDPLPSAAPLRARSSSSAAQERSERHSRVSLTLPALDC